MIELSAGAHHPSKRCVDSRDLHTANKVQLPTIQKTSAGGPGLAQTELCFSLRSQLYSQQHLGINPVLDMSINR